MSEPKWLVSARAELGTLETPGTADNPKVLQYAKDAGLAQIINHDAVSWCAAFIGAMLVRNGINGTGKATARSYEAWGESLRSPVLGCVCVLARPPVTWQGHVGFLIGANDTVVQLIGGNQQDSVSIAAFKRSRVVAYRWPVGEIIKASWVGPRVQDSVALSQTEA
jgi:uncharacterized protein (TIGR02594 family)